MAGLGIVIFQTNSDYLIGKGLAELSWAGLETFYYERQASWGVAQNLPHWW